MTSKGILMCQQLYSNINGSLENGPQLSPVHGTTPFLDKTKPGDEIVPVHETPKVEDKLSKGECFAQINNETSVEVLINGTHEENPLSETVPDGDAEPVSLLQDRVYCLPVSLPHFMFTANASCWENS